MTKEEAIKKLADIIFYVSKMGYIPYDTDDEFCAVNIAKKHIGELLPPLPSNLDEAAEIKRYIEYMYNGRFKNGSEEYIMLDKCARHFINWTRNASHETTKTE